MEEVPYSFTNWRHQIRVPGPIFVWTSLTVIYCLGRRRTRHWPSEKPGGGAERLGRLSRSRKHPPGVAESGCVMEKQDQGCPGSAVKNPPASAGDTGSTRDPGTARRGAAKPVAATAEPARLGPAGTALRPRAQLLRRVRPADRALREGPPHGESRAPQPEKAQAARRAGRAENKYVMTNKYIQIKWKLHIYQNSIKNK